MKAQLLSLVLSLFVVASQGVAGEAASGKTPSQPSHGTQELIDKFNLQVVDYDHVRAAIGSGTRKGAKATLIDARPNAKYVRGTIPSSLNIPDTQFEEYFAQIAELERDREVIVFCGGWECDKSPKVAGMLKDKGFANVKVYQAGVPEWKKKAYVEVDTAVVQSALNNNSALLIDARPHKKFLQSTIIGAVSIPDTEMESLVGRFPAGKDEKIITFCGGYDCGKSHKIADSLQERGYTNVQVYAGGMPEWKKKGLATTGSPRSTKPDTEQVERKIGKNGIKPGLDEGTVDGEWFRQLIASKEIPGNVALVDVTPTEDFGNGHLIGAINLYAEPLSAEDLSKELPEGKTVVFYCGSGARALEAWTKLSEAAMDVSDVYYFDANISCDKKSQCTIEVNEPLG